MKSLNTDLHRDPDTGHWHVMRCKCGGNGLRVAGEWHNDFKSAYFPFPIHECEFCRIWTWYIKDVKL